MKETILILASFLMVACGGSGSTDENNATNNDSSEDVNMTQGERYTVSKGNKLIKTSDNAIVRILHHDKAKTSTVILLEGDATILQKP